MSVGSPAVRLTADRSAPALARRWLWAHLRLDPVRAAEAGVLVSDLVTLAVLEQSAAEVTVGAGSSAAGVVVEVGWTAGDLLGLDEFGLTTALLDRLARRWGRSEADGSTVWFEVRTPGTVGDVSAADTDWLLSKATSDPDARDEVVRRFSPLVTGLARRFRNKGLDLSDLEQVALMGLVRALDRYDPERGPFEPYIVKTVSGELKRSLRDRAWSVRVPRSLQERTMELNRAGNVLEQRLGRMPTPAELAAEIDCPLEEVVEAMQAASAYTAASLDPGPGDDPGSPPGGWSLGGDDPRFELTDNRLALLNALESLPLRERSIVYMRFFEERTQDEIASAIGISQMHVSRLLARSVDRLRNLVA